MLSNNLPMALRKRQRIGKVACKPRNQRTVTPSAEKSGRLASRAFLWLIVLLVVQFPIIGCSLGAPCDLSPSITGQPANQSVAKGEAAIFTVAASGSSPIAYQWLKNGVPISGATGASYVMGPTLGAGHSTPNPVHHPSSKYGPYSHDQLLRLRLNERIAHLPDR
jgi:hypothetical protein